MSEGSNFNEVYLQEAEDLLAEVEACVLDIETDPDDMDAVNRLFRAMHTIKGSGSMFGFDDVASFTHHVETTLDAVRSGRIRASKDLTGAVLEARDLIKAMLEEAQGGPHVKATAKQGIIDRLAAMLPGGTAAAGTPPAPKVKEAKPEVEAWRIRFTPPKNIFTSGMDPALLLDELRELGEAQITPVLTRIPPLEQLDPAECCLGWEILLHTHKGKDAIQDVFIFVEDDSELSITQLDIVDEEAPLPRLGEILVNRGDIPSAAISDALQQQTRLGDILTQSGKLPPERVEAAVREQKFLKERQEQARRESVRVPAERLDKLVNLVGELVITQAQLARSASDYDDLVLSSAVEEIERLTGELRDIALNIRMMPIGSTFNRFRRLVRDLSTELGKEIELVTTGAETEMDKTVLERLADPLVHLIRNSIDHGVEMPDLRENLGKSRSGTIRLNAEHRGANVLISIEDDGRGLDAEVIRQKAIERGLIGESDNLAERDLFALILEAGFSTAKAVTSVSGRGVGMDVVKREMESLRGSIEIDSRLGRGTRITLSLPLTLAIIDGLMVRVGQGDFVIPISLIEECMEVNPQTMAMDRRRNVLKVRGSMVPFVRLREFFGVDGNRPELEEAVIVDTGEGRMGLVVDKVIGDHQTVIKSLGKVYRNAEGLSGATIMGDGRVALIIDVVSLIRSANGEERSALGARRLDQQRIH